MLSKLPVIRTLKIPLPGAEARSALFTDIDLSNGMDAEKATVTFISTHWMNGDPIAQLQSAIIINYFIDSLITYGAVHENQPFLLLGDLNAAEDSAPIDKMKDHWKTSNFNYGIDWLFFRPANRWKWISSRKIPDPEEKLSDHEAVVSQLELLTY
jgi:endonuclease/exonuclease/phosphatase family metal-dependent hydrolase